MRLFSSNRLSVGGINGRQPPLLPEERALMRAVLARHTRGDEVVRSVLYDTPAVDVIDDPLGLYHEAVPYETLVLVGPQELADSLKLTLPRFFTQISYRRLDFEISWAPAQAQASLVFGELLETGLGVNCGALQVITTNGSFNPILPDGGAFRLRGGQGRAIVVLGKSSAGEGLPFVDLEPKEPAQAIIITPGREGPTVQLRKLKEPAPAGQVAPVLGEVLEDPVCTRNLEFEFYEARFLGPGLCVRLVPESSFSRVLSLPRPNVDMLEIVGVFVPTTRKSRSVEGLALRFDESRCLLSHGLRNEWFRVLMVGNQERVLRWTTGKRRSIPKSGVVPDVGLRLRPARKVDDTAPPSWELLSSETSGALGWIPLRLGASSDNGDPHRVERSQLRYVRSGWIAPYEIGVEGAAIHLDWLDRAVRMVVRDDKGGTVSKGLAGWCVEQGTRMEARLRIDHDRIVCEAPNCPSQNLRNGDIFRLGPLWVRLHLANAEHSQ